MRLLIIFVSCSVVFIQCKKPYEFKQELYLLQSTDGVSFPVRIDKNQIIRRIGPGRVLADELNLTADSIDLWNPCLETRYPYESRGDTLVVLVDFGEVKYIPISTVTQDMLFSTELVKLKIEKGKGQESKIETELSFELKIGYSLRDTAEGWLMQVNDDVLEYSQLKSFQEEVKTYKESLNLTLYFHEDYPETFRDSLICELKRDSKLTLYKAYYDTTAFDYVSYSRIN